MFNQAWFWEYLLISPYIQVWQHILVGWLRCLIAAGLQERDYSAWVSCKKWRVKTGEASLACLYFPFPSHAALKLQGTQAWFPFCPAVASTPLNFIVGRSLIKLHIHQCHYLGCWFYSLIPSFATLLTSKKKYVFRYSLEASMKSDFQGEPNLNNVPIMEVISRSSIHLVVNKQ